MAITYATLAREIDGKVEYVYPKTHATMVEYNTAQSVKDKIDELDQNANTVNNRVNNLVEQTTELSKELSGVRIDGNGTVYNSAGEAIRQQFNDMTELINTHVYEIQGVINFDYSEISFDTSEIVW